MLLLSGCSALRLGYQGAPQLTWWWLDGWFDVDSTHVPRVKASIDQWFEWHRRTQLAEYAAWLSAVERRLDGPADAAQMCQWFDQGRRLLQPALDRALDAAGDLAPVLGPAQLAHLEQRQAKAMAEARREFLQPDAQSRQEAAVDRLVQRAERLYGRLNDAQRRAVGRSACQRLRVCSISRCRRSRSASQRAGSIGELATERSTARRCASPRRP